jgi:hypothetical protein
VEPTHGDSADSRRDPDPAAEDTSAARAEAAIRAIAAGADPGAEALNVSNRFTDDVTLRLSGLFRRRKRRGAASENSE